MRFPLRTTLVLLLASTALLTACRSGRPVACAKPGIYTVAQSAPPLRIPAGLDAPDTRGALRVPELNEPEVPMPKVSPCLDQPPKFSNTARLEPTQAERDLSRGKRPKAPKPAATPAPAPAPAPSPATP